MSTPHRPGTLIHLTGLLLGAVLLVSATPGRGAPAEAAAAFDAANRLYESGKPAEAATAYDHMLQAGQSSAAVYFNLGNAFFKVGQLGRAIAAYHQAALLAPRDPDIRANLQFARNRVQGPTQPPGRWQRALSNLTLNEWTVLAAGSLWLFLAALTAPLLHPRLRPALRSWSLLLALTTVLLSATVVAAYPPYQSGHTAIVVVPDVMVHNGPLDESPNLFTAHDGAELAILDHKEQWYQVSADSSRIGWVRADRVLIR